MKEKKSVEKKKKKETHLGPKRRCRHFGPFVCCLFVVGAGGEAGGGGGVVESGGGRVMSWHP